MLLRAQVLVKEKLDRTVSSRMPVDGSCKPAGTYGDTYASTSDAVNRSFLLSICLAAAVLAGKLCLFFTGRFDVPAAFLQNLLPRSETGGRQFVPPMTADLPQIRLADGTLDSKAGDYAELLRSIYGIKQSNAIFDYDFCQLLVSHGWQPLSLCEVDRRGYAIYLMRYLKGCSTLGPVFSSDTDSYLAGVSLCGADGRSPSGYTLTVGTNIAPFLVYSKVEDGGIPLSPCESEYMTLSKLARITLYFR